MSGIPTLLAALVLACAAAAGAAAQAAPLDRALATAPQPSTAGGVGASAATAVKLTNAGFEAPLKADGDPTGWTTGQHAGVASYVFVLDAKVRHGGRQSLRIDNTGPEPFGAIVQPVPVTGLAGRTLRLSGWVRTREAGGGRKGWGAALQLQAKKGGSPVAYTVLADHVIGGTSDWKRREAIVAIPVDAEAVEVGILLRGKGSVWLDDVELEVLPAS